MKRMFTVIMATMLAVFMLAACGSSKPNVEGVYQLDKINDKTVMEYFEDMGITADDLALFGMTEDSMKDMFKLTIEKDGKAKLEMSMMGESETQDLTWTLDGDKITLAPTDDASDTIVATIKDKTLSLDLDGDSWTLVKQ